jgi:hypothetical protein
MPAIPINITLSKGVAKVTIDTVSVEQSWLKTITTFNVPKTTENQSLSSGANDTRVVDLLLKAEKRFTIRGHVSNDVSGTDGDKDRSGLSITDAKDKRQALKDIFFAGMADNTLVTMTYEGDTYQVALEKCTVNWDANDESPITRYDITITCITGVSI